MTYDAYGDAAPRMMQMMDNGTIGVFDFPTIRDQFAMAALTGWCTQDLPSQPYAIVARECYEIADAMMEARK